MNKSLLLSLLFLLPTFVWGEGNSKALDIYEKVTTLKGDTYEGYIKRQTIGESIEFYSVVSTIMDSTYVETSMSEKFVPESQLDEIWKLLIEKGLVESQTEGGKKGLLLRSFETKENIASDVYVLQKGENFVHYIDIQKRNVKINFSEIKQIDYLYDPNESSQLIDVVKYYDSKRGEVKGYIVEQIIGKSLSVKDVASSMVTKVELSDIESIGKCKKTPSLSWEEQSRWIETVEHTGGTIEGVVTQKKYGAKDGDAYMVITTLDGSYEVVKMDQVMSIGRKLNREYISILSSEFADTSALFNGVKVNELTLKEPARFNLNRGDVVIKNARKLFTDIRVKTSHNQNAPIILQRQKSSGAHDVVAFKVIINSEDELVCSYKDILNYSKNSVNENSDDVVINRFKLPHGMYMFYVKGANKVYLVNIRR